MAPAPEVAEKVKDLLRKVYVDAHLEAWAARDAAASKGSSRKDDPQRVERARAEFERRHRVTRRIPGGYFTFDDTKPDPGAAFEIHHLHHLDLTWHDPSKQLTDQLAIEEPLHPMVTFATEFAREAHWKVTAPKGFAALKGIPELQQLLVYTAADVVHYATENDELGQPGTWRPYLMKAEDDYLSLSSSDSSSKDRVACLSDSSSLIGQLCPGLRLCLAAEVAAGLVCDSQPPPPNTPEHASALLLFLAAALKQVEQECQSAEYLPGISSWRLNPSIANCQHLNDFYACPSVGHLLDSIDEELKHSTAAVAAAAAAAAAPQAAAAGSSNSSSSGGGGSRVQVPPPAACGGNVLVAAWWLAEQMTQMGAAAGQIDPKQQQQQEAAQPRQLMEHTTQLLDSYLQATTHTACPSVPAPAAAGDQASAGSSSGSSTSSNALPPPPASDVAWHLAAVAAGAALCQLMAAVSTLQGHHHSSRSSSGGDSTSSSSGGGTTSSNGSSGGGSTVSSSLGSSAGSSEGGGDAADETPQWVLAFTLHLALLSTAVHALHESICATLQDAAAVWQQQRRQQQQQQQQQQQRQGGLLGSGSSSGVQDAAAAAAAAYRQGVKQAVMSQVLEVLDMAQAFHESLLQLAAEPHPSPDCSISSGGASSSSRGDGGSGDAGRAAWAKQVALSAALAAADSHTDSSSVKHGGALLTVQHMAGLPNSPALQFQQAFSLAGEQQLSPLCLHPDLLLQGRRGTDEQQPPASAGVVAAVELMVGGAGQAARSAAAAAAAAPPAAAEAAAFARRMHKLRTDAREWENTVWNAVSHWRHHQQQDGRQKLPAAAAAASSRQGSSSSSSNQASALAAAAAGDQLQGLVSQAEGWLAFVSLAWGVFEWQKQWGDHAGSLARLKQLEQHEQAYLMRKKVDKYLESREKYEKAKAKAEASAQQQQQDGKPGKAPKRKQKGTAAAGSSKPAADGGLELSSDDEDHQGGKGGKRDSAAGKQDDCYCRLCAAEGPIPAALQALQGSSSGSGQGAGGLYANLPVSWSDPFMMRRLLWDLLGRLKPAAQQWFRKHAQVCPHSISVDRFEHVAASIARHIWAPPGEWGQQHEQQQVLLLPHSLRTNPDDREADAAEPAARASYAHTLNAGFAAQGAQGQAAAVLSLQALLALDPHGARVQPRPELLLYTPAGFHAAVCKTLMQTLLSPEQWGSAGPSSSCAVPNGAVSGGVTPPRRREQLPEQQHLQQQPHALQAWTASAFPAWYVWWHIGLLAYQQQQQQQQESGAGGRRGSSTGSGGCSGGCSGSGVDLYSSPEARLFAVGYAARQVSCRSQLERLLSNPPAAPGLAIAPADWLAVPPAGLECEQCGVQVSMQQNALVCCGCWRWYCGLPCYTHRCRTSQDSCTADPLVQAKAGRRWRLLELLQPRLVLQTQPPPPAPPQQQRQKQQKQQQVAAGRGAAHTGSQPSSSAAAGQPTAPLRLHCIPGATHAALPALCSSLLEMHPNQQRLFLPRQQPGLGYVPLWRLHEPLPWQQHGCGSPVESRIIAGMTQELAAELEVKGLTIIFNSNDPASYIKQALAQQPTYAKLQRCQQQQYTPRQQRLQQQHQGSLQHLGGALPPGIAPGFASRSSPLHQHNRQQQGTRGYGPHPAAAAAAAGRGPIDKLLGVEEEEEAPSFSRGAGSSSGCSSRQAGLLHPAAAAAAAAAASQPAGWRSEQGPPGFDRPRELQGLRGIGPLDPELHANLDTQEYVMQRHQHLAGLGGDWSPPDVDTPSAHASWSSDASLGQELDMPDVEWLLRQQPQQQPGFVLGGADGDDRGDAAAGEGPGSSGSSWAAGGDNGSLSASPTAEQRPAAGSSGGSATAAGRGAGTPEGRQSSSSGTGQQNSSSGDSPQSTGPWVEVD